MIDHREDPKVAPLYELSFGKRPAEELYDCRTDPHQMKNLAADAALADAKKKIAADLDKYLADTKDPRILGAAKFDEYPYTGSAKEKEAYKSK